MNSLLPRRPPFDQLAARKGNRLNSSQSSAMRAGLRVDALVRQAQPFDWVPSDEVFTNNLLGVLGLNVPVPDSLRVDDHRRAVLALVQAASFVDSDSTSKARGFREHL